MFQNRAALKLVEIDAICDRIFTQPDCWTKSGLMNVYLFILLSIIFIFNHHHIYSRYFLFHYYWFSYSHFFFSFFFFFLAYFFTTDKREPLYFADVCAGPGGFTEYMLYKWAWQAKGFGFTLSGMFL